MSKTLPAFFCLLIVVAFCGYTTAKGRSDCQRNGGKCVARRACKGDQTPKFSCPKSRQVCCQKPKPIKTKCEDKNGECVKTCEDSSVLSGIKCPRNKGKKVCCKKPDSKPNRPLLCRLNGGSCVPSRKCSNESVLPHYRCRKNAVCCNASDLKPTRPTRPTKPTSRPSCKSMNGSQCVPPEKCSNESVLLQYRCPGKKGKVCCQVLENKPSCKQANGTCVAGKKCDGSARLSGFTCPKDKHVCCKEKKKLCKSMSDTKCVPSDDCRADMLNSDLVCPRRKVCCSTQLPEP